MSDQGWSYRHISRALLLDEQTVSRHVEEYIEEKKLTLSSGGSQSKLSALQTELLIAHLERFTYLKIEYICECVRLYYGVSYAVKGMTSWMHDHEFSYKKPNGNKGNLWVD